MAKEYVPIFYDWLDTTQDLSAEEKGNLIDAIISYAAGCEYEHLLTEKVKIAFRFMKGAVDRSNDISAKRSKAASGDSNENKSEQNETNGNKTEQTETNTNDKDNNKDNNKDKDKDKDNNKKRFTPPSVEDVAAYCRERGNAVDAQAFVSFYESKGWKVGNTPMKSWKAAVQTWERNRSRDAPAYKRTVNAQQFTQRDYSSEDDEVARRMLAMVEEGSA